LQPTTLEDFQVLADEVSKIAQACQTVAKRLEAQGSGHNAATAFQQVQNELDWAECKTLNKSSRKLLTSVL
jgi:hypothetical protein